MPANTPSTEKQKDMSVDELIAQQQQALEALIARKRDEEEKARLEREANMTPEERILSKVERRLAHMDAQIVRLGGHSYKLYE